MTYAVADIELNTAQDSEAAWVTNLWTKYHDLRSGWLEEKKELRNYLFATDTTTTTNESLPWKNSTTLPKLTQLRDNLHSNYLSSLFPHDDWLLWEGYSKDDQTVQKVKAIQAYMANKVRESGARSEYSKMLYDYIDYGLAITTTGFETRTKTLDDGSIVPTYIGPVPYRLSPLDVVFNPTAKSFDDSFKVVRSLKTVGELAKLVETQPEQAFWKEVLDRRGVIANMANGFSREDFDKAVGYEVDGFGSMHEYYLGQQVEVLEFFGDYYNPQTQTLQTDRVITVVDRSITVRNVQIPTWFTGSPIRAVGWRMRTDNLYPMGPLDNLVGLQYRLDHLENLKADAMDLVVNPPLKVYGEVEEFEWAPGAEITIDEGGDVQELAQNMGGIIQASNEMAQIEQRMELYAGAPRDAMGIRSPGEKTAFEVQTLDNAAGRIFQDKITNFEIGLLEPSLNDQLESARRNLDVADIVRTSANELGITQFLSITKEDITANGKIRPIGARHFAKKAQDLQNLIGVFNSPIGAMIAPHTSGKEMTKFVNNISGLDGYSLFKPNIAVFEQQETQRLVAQAQEDLEVEQANAAQEPDLVEPEESQ